MWIALHITALLQAITQLSLCNISCGIFPFTPTGTFFYPTSRLCLQSHKQRGSAGREQAHCLLAEECVWPSALLRSVGACREGESTKHLLNLGNNLIWLGFLLPPRCSTQLQGSVGGSPGSCWGWTPPGAPGPTSPSSTAPFPCHCLTRAGKWKHFKQQHNPQVGYIHITRPKRYLQLEFSSWELQASQRMLKLTEMGFH